MNKIAPYIRHGVYITLRNVDNITFESIKFF